MVKVIKIMVREEQFKLELCFIVRAHLQCIQAEDIVVFFSKIP